ncbi:MAG: hypothetical protein M1272_07345 [Firmicutes bacterium]|nr:hypothetical protein [Bacillota bacterium]
MKTIGWMLSLLGALLGGFTTWAERLPGLESHLVLPHANLPGSEITLFASLVALVAVVIVWVGWYRLGGLIVAAASIVGFFGADQLWVTAGCVLFVGAVLTLFSGRGPENDSPEANPQ